MDFSFDEQTTALIAKARRFVDERVLPAEPGLDAQLAQSPDEWTVRPIVREVPATPFEAPRSSVASRHPASRTTHISST